MIPLRLTAIVGAFILLFAVTCKAHFGMVIPSSNIVTQQHREISLTLSFSHPFESIGMDMAKPHKFFVFNGKSKTDLLEELSETRVMDHLAWQTEQKIKRPGVYQYVMEPKPYWEPAEDLYIIHYTKTIIAAFGADEHWNQPVGLPAEIIPLLRPYGNYGGNTFTGQVLLGGKPAANSEVEVELYDKDKLYHHPSDYHITQVVQTDERGVFTFTCPVAGWWGFSALSEADYTLKSPDNIDKNVEIGAVLWLYFDPMNQRGAM